MANRARVKKPRYIIAQSTGASFNGPWLNIEGIDNLSFIVAWTGTTNGTLTIEGSNDGPLLDASTRQDAPSGVIGATTIATLGSGNPAGSADSVCFPLTDRAEVWARLVFTRSSGTGAMSCAFAGKGI